MALVLYFRSRKSTTEWSKVRVTKGFYGKFHGPDIYSYQQWLESLGHQTKIEDDEDLIDWQLPRNWGYDA